MLSHGMLSQSTFSLSVSWWHHQMEIFSALLALCAGNSPIIGEYPTQRPVTWSFDVFFDLRLNKRLSKLSWGWWHGMPSRSLWHHCDVLQETKFAQGVTVSLDHHEKGTLIISHWSYWWNSAFWTLVGKFMVLGNTITQKRLFTKLPN